VIASGPPRAIGKGLVTNGFIAMLFTERYVAGRSQNSLVADLARHGAEVSPTTLTGVGLFLHANSRFPVFRAGASWPG
jgi:hypothetical protein